MRLGGPSAKPEVTKKELPMAFAVMEALKDTRQVVMELFEKYDMNGDREIQVRLYSLLRVALSPEPRAEFPVVPRRKSPPTQNCSSADLAARKRISPPHE